MKRRLAELLYAIADRLLRLAWWLTACFALGITSGCIPIPINPFDNPLHW